MEPTTPTPNQETSPMSTPILLPVISPVQADENGRGNLAGYRATCACGLEMTSTMLSSLQLDLAQHATWHLSKAGQAADARRELRRTPGWTDGITTDDEALEALAYARGEA
jgi:hypothetical protein